MKNEDNIMSKKTTGIRDEIGNRMKSYYEDRAKTYLLKKVPVIIRIDGKAFHTFTKKFKKPFDAILIKTMQETTQYLCSVIQGCKFGYTQSDEISLLLSDLDSEKAETWFDYSVEKITSIAASEATFAFNKFFVQNVKAANVNDADYSKILTKAIDKGARFDARCFNIPVDEVFNYFYWRQLDASTNSVSMVAHTMFTTTELNKKSWSEMQDMIFQKASINWNNYSEPEKRGTAVYKVKCDATREFNGETINYTRNKWEIDTTMPELKNDNKDYIMKWLVSKEN